MVRVSGLLLVVVLVLVFVSGCWGNKVTGDAVKDVWGEGNVSGAPVKRLVNESVASEARGRSVPREVGEVDARSCEEKVDDLMEELEEARLDVLIVEGELRRLSLEAAYLKGAFRKEEAYKAKVEAVEAKSDEKREVVERARELREEVKALAEECGVRIRLDKD